MVEIEGQETNQPRAATELVAVEKRGRARSLHGQE